MAGLDPAIHPFFEMLLPVSMDARIKSGHDSVFCIGTSLGHTSSPFPRRLRTRVIVTSSSLEARAQGMPGARRTRSLARKEESVRVSHHRFAEAIRHSLRVRFTVSFVLSPEIGPEIGLGVSVAPEKR